MGLLALIPILTTVATVSNSLAGNAMQSFVAPVVSTMGILAGIVCTLFIVNGGYHYMTGAGNPERIEHAKQVIRNALLGLLVVLAAVVLVGILRHAYTGAAGGSAANMPPLTTIQPAPASSGLVDVLIKAITGLLQAIIESIATPFMTALGYFTSATPLMAANGSVFKLWLAVVGITDGLFTLVVALLGFHVMSYATLGLEEVEFKHLLPRIGAVFLLFNTSIFAIDGIISLSNAMIHALDSAFTSTSVWYVLSGVAKQAGGFGIAALLIMAVFLVLSVILLVYYVGRLVTLYLGAVLSPLVILLWLVPGFRDFAENAAKVYLVTVFVLFIHVAILQLAAGIFAGLLSGGADQTPDALTALLVGLATVVALLKTQGVLMQLSYVSVGPRMVRRLGGQFATGVSYLTAHRSINTARPGDRSGTWRPYHGQASRSHLVPVHTVNAPSVSASPERTPAVTPAVQEARGDGR